MNKTELTKQVAAEMSITQREAQRFINVILRTMQDELRENNCMVLQGFGTFSPWEQTERIGRNPRTGTACSIPSRTSVKFKPGKVLLKVLNEVKG